MREFLQGPTAQLVVSLTVFVALLAVAYYVVTWFRKPPKETGPDASELMTNFRELHSQGELSDEEYRTIKTMLATKLQAPLAPGNAAPKSAAPQE